MSTSTPTSYSCSCSCSYWETAILQANKAKQYELSGNYEVAFSMYKSAIISLLSGVKEDTDVHERRKVKEKTSEYLSHAERIYNNHLVPRYNTFQTRLSRIPWRARSQLSRYVVVNSIGTSLLVYDSAENIFVVIKGIQKTSNTPSKNDVCILPKDVPYMVKLFALHETDTTVFFVLEYVRYGKLWDHLEHYFLTNYNIEELDTEISYSTQNGEDEDDDDNAISDSSSFKSISDSSNMNHSSLSRLESSVCTGTTSCESLCSSHDETYFDLIEDYAKIRNKNLKEVQTTLGETRKHVETVRQFKKTLSQLDLKLLNESFAEYKSHSFSNLIYDDEFSNISFTATAAAAAAAAAATATTTTTTVASRHQSNVSSPVGEFHFYTQYKHKHKHDDDDDNDNDDDNNKETTDMNTVQLLKNTQILIESISEMLSKTENFIEINNNFSDFCETSVVGEGDTGKPSVIDHCGIDQIEPFSEENMGKLNRCSNFIVENKSHKKVFNECTAPECECSEENLADGYDLKPTAEVLKLNLFTPISPNSNSVASVTEDYSFISTMKKTGITSELIKKWAVQILIAVETLHQNGIICRDLNPSNILLSDNGSVKLTYFFRYPNVELCLNLNAKEKLYVAPEVINIHSNVTFASDWWSFGAILYELVTSQSLYENHPNGICSHTIISFPDKIQSETRSLLTELLRYNPNERLGSGICGVDDIKAHPYFTDVNWKDVT